MTSTTTARLMAIGAGLALVAGCERLTPEQQLVQTLARTFGGEAVVQATGVLTLEGTGVQYNLGQDLRPGLAGQTFTVTAYRREYDLTSPRLRVTQTRTPTFSYFQGPQAQTQVQGVDGDVAYGASGDGASSRGSLTAAAERRAERYHHPLVLLRAALAEGASLSLLSTSTGLGPGEQGLTIDTPAGRVDLIAGADGLPTRIVSSGSHPNLGDVRLTTAFESYRRVDGVQFPSRLVTKVDDFTTGEYEIASRLAPADLSAPSAAAGTAPPTPALNLATTELAPGVWLIAGQSHHSAVVDLGPRLVIIEAPQSETRSIAAIRRARELKPGTPLTHVVMTHHHFDHSAGLRAAVAEGLTVVTHEGNEAFVKEMAARPFTLAPDALARGSKPVTVEAVGAMTTLGEGARALQLHHLAGNPHSETMLMAYLPAERMVIQVDAFSPGGTYHPYAENLIGHIERLKLQVDRVVPLHGSPLTYKDMVTAVRPAS